MKAYLLTICFFISSCLMLFSQTNVTLNIHHKLGDQDFAMETAVVNNQGSNFNFTRLEYYIAEISLIHDGGQETMVNDLYMLVDASEETTQELGEMAVTTVEAIRFHIGVDEATNHVDPAGFANGHPLAPQFPSMHWGWAAGYRFGAFEGNSGTTLNQTWEIHALEDANYFQTEVILNTTAENDELVIDINADYIRGMENINLNSGPITHGGFGEAVTALRNFKDLVFSSSNLVNTNEEALSASQVKLFPNPTPPQQSNLLITSDKEEFYQIRITNTQGQLLRQMAKVASNTTVDLNLTTTGVYFISILQNGQTLRTERLIVQ
ncbi:MAG: MbnP family protein [Bacteroidota bacterium]